MKKWNGRKREIYPRVRRKKINRLNPEKFFDFLIWSIYE